MSGKSALLLGATGAVGRHVLTELLASPHFARVGEYGRNVTDPAQLAGRDTAKLEQQRISFDSLDEARLREGKWDVVFITLGTTRAAAGSAAAFERIDREYVVNAARAAKSDDASHSQRIVYLSSAGANASSSFLYPRSKGLTENALAALGYSDTIIFRPGALQGADRKGTRIAEHIFTSTTRALSFLTDSLGIDVDQLAKSIRLAGQLGSTALPPAAGATTAGSGDTTFTLIGNKGAIALAKNEK